MLRSMLHGLMAEVTQKHLVHSHKMERKGVLEVMKGAPSESLTP